MIDYICGLFIRYSKFRFLTHYKKTKNNLYLYYKTQEFLVFRSEKDIYSWNIENDNTVFQGIKREFAYKKTQTEIAFENYCGYHFIYINELLRLGKCLQYIDDEFAQILLDNVRLMNIEIHKRRLLQKTIVIRWVYFQNMEMTFNVKLKNIEEGAIYVDKGFMSTSLNFDYYCSSGSRPRNFAKSILFILSVPTGAACMYMSALLSDRLENELLFPTGTAIKVTNIRYRFHQSAIIEADILS